MKWKANEMELFSKTNYFFFTVFVYIIFGADIVTTVDVDSNKVLTQSTTNPVVDLESTSKAEVSQSLTNTHTDTILNTTDDQKRVSITHPGTISTQASIETKAWHMTRTTRTVSSTGPRIVTQTLTLPTLVTLWFTEVYYQVTATLMGPDILERSNKVLSSPITQAFLAKFENELQVRVISEQLQFCPHRPLCNFSWPDPINPVQYNMKLCCEGCRCDEGCIETMNCCPDYIPEISYSLNHRIQYKRCVYNSLRGMRGGTYAFNSCPVGTDFAMQINCSRSYNGISNLQTIDVLIALDHLQNKYRNMYCALCNNVPRDNLTFLSPKLACENDTTASFLASDNLIESVFDTPDCDILLVERVFREDEECVVPIARCNETGLWFVYDSEMEWSCSIYYSPLKAASQRFYQNVFCMLCNGDSEVKTLCSIFDSSKFVEKFSFAAVLNVETHEKSAVVDPSQNSCSVGFVQTESDCIPAHCSILRKLEGDSCVRVLASVTNIYYITYFRLIPVRHLSTKTAYNSFRDVLVQIGDNIRYTVGGWAILNSIDCLIQTDLTFHRNVTTIGNLLNSSVTFFDIRVKFELHMVHDPEEIQDSFQKLNGDKIRFTIPHLDFLEISCIIYLKDDSGVVFNELDNTEVRNIIYSFAFYNEETLENAIVPFQEFNVNDQYTILPYVLYSFGSSADDGIKLASMLTCPMVNVSFQTQPWEESLHGIFFSKANVFLNFSDFAYTSDSVDMISVCLDIFIRIKGYSPIPVDPGQPMSTESLVSLCCVSLSIIFLLFTILTFCCLPGFDTLPWKNNLCLASSLFLAQIFYLVASNGNFVKRSIVCKIVGGVLHYCLLMSVIWMNICTFHMYRVLSSNTLISNTKKGYVFLIYFLYSLFVPFLFVLTIVLYSLSTTGWPDVGYGDIICYINSQIMVLLTFGLPLALVVVSNLCMFWMVMRRIKATPKIRKNVKNERNFIIICAKLSIITGLTWVVGLVHMFTHIGAFSYIFIVLNGSQGVFLMISFVCNQKVWHMYKSMRLRSSYGTS